MRGPDYLCWSNYYRAVVGFASALIGELSTGLGPLGQLQLELGLPPIGADVVIFGSIAYRYSCLSLLLCWCYLIIQIHIQVLISSESSIDLGEELSRIKKGAELSSDTKGKVTLRLNPKSNSNPQNLL